MVEFLTNEELWASKDWTKIDIEREKVLTLLKNKTTNVDFLPQNRLIFAFQKNIVKNKKLKEYCDWFELAEKTRNKNNVEEDFEDLKKNPTIMAVMERIEKKRLPEEELSALEALERELALSAIWRVGVREDMRQEVLEEVKKEVRSEVKEEVRSEVKEEVTRQIQVEMVLKTHKQGLEPSFISVILSLPIEKIDEIIADYKKKNNEIE